MPAGFSSSSGSSSNGSGGSPGTPTLLSELRALLDTTPAQQADQEARLLQALCSCDCHPPGVLLSSCVLGGYLWQVSLVGAPYRRPCQQPVGNPPPAATAAGEAPGCDRERQRQQLAVSIICRPAWAVNLDSSSSSSTAGTPCAGASVLACVEGLTAALGCGCAAAGLAESGLQAEAATAAGQSGPHLGSTCGVCRSLRSIAVSKAAAAADRHLPGGAARSGSSDGSRSTWPCAHDVLVGVNVTAAPSAALLQAVQGLTAAKAPAEAFTAVQLCWSHTTGAAYGLVPLDVSGISAASSNLVTGWAPSNGELLPAGAVHPAAAAAAGPADPAAAGAAAGAVGGAEPDSSLAVGWQPELWSRLAYTGELHWLCRLRLLSD